MKPIIIAILALFMFCSFICSNQQNVFKVKIKNPNNFFISDAYIELGIENSNGNFTIKDGEEVIPYQVVQSILNRNFVSVVLNLEPSEEKILSVYFGDESLKQKFANRTYAELAMKPHDIYYDGRFRGNEFVNVTKIKVPSIHTDHDALFKYEGPGWESEKVGYRFYLDWRNAIDIFGKKKDALILASVGVHDTVAKDDSYHNMQDWGMDIFKVGNSLGIGSIGMWYDGKVHMVSKTDSVYFEIIENGPVKSEIKTTYFGWKVGEDKFKLESKLSITAGSRLSQNEIEISEGADNIVTGLAKYPGTYFFKDDNSENWSYIALYGNQTLVNDNDKLGIALFYNKKDLLELTENDLSYVVKLRPNTGKLNYYFCAAWEQEEFAVKNLDEFKNYLNKTKLILNNPVQVGINK